MPQFLLSVHGSDDVANYLTPEDMARAFRDVDALNTDLQATGAWVFAGGLLPASTAKVVRRKDGALLHTDGPFLESKEQIGGFWVIQAADLDEALALAARGSKACRGRVEVRPFHGE